MKKKYFIILMIVTVFTSMLFSACGKKDTMTLEKYIADNPEIQGSIDQATVGSNVAVKVEGNEIIYTFDLSTMDGYTEEIAKSDEIIKALETALTSASSTFGGISKSLEESTEIQGITTTVNYTWGDELLFTKSFTSADAVEDTAE